jgi:O-acetyl-ADP-ribose deacetylase (regulator of RNase III)
MAIRVRTGNVVEDEAEALVNTVNCVGFMGKGIALQFRKAFPANNAAYVRACEAEEVRPGSMFVYETGALTGPKYIINFPTKRHWRAKSRLDDIDAGLKALVDEIRDRGIRSIAVPPLGCGLGGLEWTIVRPRIEQALGKLSDLEVHLYEPTGSPPPETMPIGTKRPSMTLARALMVSLMHEYSRWSYRLTLLEIQKLAYFLQESGEPMRLRYEPGQYGPYAHNLNMLLEVMEGHFTRGYGDSQRPDVEIRVLPGAAEEAAAYYTGTGNHAERLSRVIQLIEGFEAPHGMELLASVHWVAKHNQPAAASCSDAVEAVHGWNERKLHMFPDDHIRIAWNRLATEGWIGVN